MMIEINERGFDKAVLKCELPVFVCFTTKWCYNCFPTCLLVDELLKEYESSIKFVKVDIEESPGIAERYHVVAVPTILLFQDSQVVEKLLGFQDQWSLKSLIDSVNVKEESS